MLLLMILSSWLCGWSVQKGKIKNPMDEKQYFPCTYTCISKA